MIYRNVVYRARPPALVLACVLLARRWRHPPLASATTTHGGSSAAVCGTLGGEQRKAARQQRKIRSSLIMLPAATAKRLLADCKQLQREPIPTCNAEPEGDDLRHWRLSLTCSEGPHAGSIFHGKITFPDDYPSKPPTIQLCTELAHPNVFRGYDFNQHARNEDGYYICLNMLRPLEEQDTEAYSGWSSAYTVHAILMQLSSFLFAENIPQDHGGSVRCRSNVQGTKRDADAFHAAHGHKYPPLAPLNQPTFAPLRADRTMQLKLTVGRPLSIVGDNGHLLCARCESYSSPPWHHPWLPRYATAVGNAALSSGSVYFEVILEQLAEIGSENDACSLIRVGVAEHTDAIPDYSEYGQQDVGRALQGDYGSNSWVYDVSAGCGFHDGRPINLTTDTATETQAPPKYSSLKATAGDTLGVTLLRCNETGTAILSFAHNGRDLGALRFHTRQALTPAVTLKCPFGQALQVRFNFGQRQFNFPPPSIEAAKQDLLLPRVASADERCRRSLLLRLGADAAFKETHACAPQQQIDPFDRLPDETLLAILKYLEPRDLAAAAKTNRALCAAICRYNVWERREALCFHSKATMDEEVLGLGFSIEHHGRSADIKSIHAELDLLSQSAYDSGVRRGVWQERFDRWVPLWLCDKHGERAWPRLLACVHDCATAGLTGAPVLTPTSTGEAARRRSRQYLEFFGKAMNAFVVSMMGNKEDDLPGPSGRYPRQQRSQSSRKQKTALHASERALLGYCSFHHLLLAFCARFPLMREEANAMVARAIDGRTSKDEIPDLGVFLALLTVTDQSWSCSQLAWAVLGETLDRNVRWALPNMPYLRRFERAMTGTQAEQVCKAATVLADWLIHTATSQRVLMFQAYFLTVVGRPKGAHPSVVLGHYNCSLGRPSARMVENLRVACGEIMATSDWPGFFNRLGLPLPGKAQVAHRLRVAVQNSRQKGYHGPAPSSGRGAGGFRREQQHGQR